MRRQRLAVVYYGFTLGRLFIPPIYGGRLWSPPAFATIGLYFEFSHHTVDFFGHAGQLFRT